MDDVAPHGSDILNFAIEASCDALDQGLLVFSRTDILLYASRNIQSFFPVAKEDVAPGVCLRDLLGAIFDTGLTRGLPGRFRKSDQSASDWISERIAGMWSERTESIARVGRERWLSVTTRRLGSGLGIVMLRDVSAIHKMEERWSLDIERVAMTEEILDNLPDPVVVRDRNMTFVAVNRAYCRLHGVSADSILGRSVWDLVDPATAELYETQARHVLDTGVSLRQAEEIRAADGRAMRVNKHIFRAGKPGQYFVVTLLQDLSLGHPAFEDDASDVEPIHTRHEANAYPEHEVLLEMPKMEPDFEADDDVQAEGETSEARVIVASSDVVFGETLALALKSFQFDAYHVPTAASIVPMIDAAREMGIAINLVLADEADLPGVAGISEIAGVPLVNINRGRPMHFVVADAAAFLTRAHQAGVGRLPIMEEGGFPGPDSLGMPDFQQADDVEETGGYGVEILVAEDNPINQNVFRQILEGLGIGFQLAKDGAEAVRLWEVLRPRLVLMDTTLPVMDGKAATRRIREIEAGSRRRTTIIGVLPRQTEAECSDCIESGMDGTIVKPLHVETLEKLYQQYVMSNSVTLANQGR
jgi:PAS domain S-box-containing protein